MGEKPFEVVDDRPLQLAFEWLHGTIISVNFHWNFSPQLQVKVSWSKARLCRCSQVDLSLPNILYELQDSPIKLLVKFLWIFIQSNPFHWQILCTCHWHCHFSRYRVDYLDHLEHRSIRSSLSHVWIFSEISPISYILHLSRFLSFNWKFLLFSIWSISSRDNWSVSSTPMCVKNSRQKCSGSKAGVGRLGGVIAKAWDLKAWDGKQDK